MADTSFERPFLPLARPTLGEAEVEAVRRVLLSGWVSQGPEVEAFEGELAAAVGAPHSCAVSSATAALHLALLAVGVRPGDEVVTVSHSFVATAASVRHCGALPVFVDVDSATGNLDPALIESAITSRTRAILCVHQLGMPCDVFAIREIAVRHGLALVEDAACALGSEIHGPAGWESIGRPHGDIACFSFHGRKVLTTGEGGMLTTSDPALDRSLRRLRQHGTDLRPAARHSSKEVELETYEELGYNYRMSDLAAAVGREQLKRLPRIVAHRRALAARYGELLVGFDGVAAPHEPSWARSNWQSFAVHLADNLDQRSVMQRLLDDGIATRRGVTCAHRQRAFPPGCWRSAGPLPASEHAEDRTILLPLFPEMSDGDVARVVDSLRRACP